MDLSDDNSILVRLFDEDTDSEAVESLERSCELGAKRRLSIFSNMMDDPLCRIRFHKVRVMLVAELVRSRELVGVVRGCIKSVGSGSETSYINLGWILGLRVSPKHRRKGIGQKLVKSVESWAIKNGAEYICLATEESNIASRNLFVLKFGYVKLSPLRILVQHTHPRLLRSSRGIKIEKLSVDHAISLYKDRLSGKELFPLDIDVILKQELSLGTWVSYFKDEEWCGLGCKQKNDTFTRTAPSSWAILSMWNTSRVYKLQVRGAPVWRFLQAAVRGIGASSCLVRCGLPSKPFGFIFLYGLYGEGEKTGELMRSLWCFACNLARNLKGCRAIVTELGAYDPLREHFPVATTTSCIADLWFFKKLNGTSSEEDEWSRKQPLPHLFVDPRDF
ncbi:probable N-acetyltransferase HLS1 [Aristolochia californica]|uniref:probable N-acetyltransferase HLS1 n=1 Tax=Aristolochia californica TaxID=171875 RepID=UPI0035DC2D35